MRASRRGNNDTVGTFGNAVISNVRNVTAINLRTIVNDRPRFEGWFKVSISNVVKPPSDNVTQEQFHRILNLFANSFALDTLSDESIDKFFVRRDVNQQGFVSKVDATEVAYEFFTHMYERYNPLAFTARNIEHTTESTNTPWVWPSPTTSKAEIPLAFRNQSTSAEKKDDTATSGDASGSRS
eukprot:PhF_6_TR30351/c0_g1_i2/m.44462